MPVQQAFKGNITLSFDYKETPNSGVRRESILPQRISYVMIERMYENVNILPVIYISLNISSEMYTKVVNTHETSKFHLRIQKRNALSGTSTYTTVVDDTFSYVTSTTTANYSKDLDVADPSGSSYKNIMIGLVSVTMTNNLRKSFNGIYENIDQVSLVKLALEGLPRLVQENLKYNSKYGTFLIPPINTRYRLLEYLFEKDPFYDSMFTFFMDFDRTYFVSKNAIGVDAHDNQPTNAIINVKGYTAAEAYTDGFTMSNGTYVVYVNAANTEVTVNNATEKVVNNLVAYSDTNEIQNLSLAVNNSEDGDTTEKVNFIRTPNAAALKNELQSNSVSLQILKQNLDSDIFTPNKVYNVRHYEDYSKYDGPYYLSYKREFYYVSTSDEFIVSCNVGLKMCGTEEAAYATRDTTRKPAAGSKNAVVKSSSTAKTTSSSKRKVSQPATNVRNKKK
jgi:hypothetical protein